MLRKFICLISTLLLVCCLICNNYVFAYENPIEAVADSFDGTSLVEQGCIALKNNVPNYRFCYAYDYDGDGLQEGYAISGIWEEGIQNGDLWFIDSDGTYKLVKKGLYCHVDLLEPELAYAGNQIFLILNQMQNGRVISLVCGDRNGKAYFPTISEHVADFHSENGHYYAYNIADYSGVKYFYDEAAGEFVSDFNMTKNIDIDYLTKYYWYYDCGDYSKYQFKKDGTYTRYRYDGSIYADGQRYSLDNNILTFHYEWGDSSWIYVDKKASNELSFLADGEKVFYAPDTGYEYIGNTYEEVPVEKEIKVVLNGSELSFEQPPIIKDDRTLVPMRAIFEAMGATVDWEDSTKTVTSKKGSTTIILTIGSNTMHKNDVTTYLDVPAQLIGDYTMVPVRAVAESFGADVTWDESTRTICIDINTKTHGIVIYADAKYNEIAAQSFTEILRNNQLGTNAQDVHCRYEPSEDEYNQILSLVRQNAKDEDITYFFYAGHGDDDGGIYPDYNNDSNVDTYMKTPTQLISDLQDIPGTIIVILESCHSGCIQNVENLDRNKFKIITSSTENQYSDTDHLGIVGYVKDKRLGAFSEALLNGLGGLEGTNIIYNTITGRDGTVKADYNNDRSVTISELFTYIDDNMDHEYWYQFNLFKQDPTCSNANDQTVIYAY